MKMALDSGHMDLWGLILVEFEVGLSFLGAKMHLLLLSLDIDTSSFSRYTQGVPMWEQWYLLSISKSFNFAKIVNE